MPCENGMHKSQRLAFERWKADRQARCNAAYSPILPDEDALYNAVLCRLRRENAAKCIPVPVCSTCGFPVSKADRDPLFKRRCSTCGCRHVDKLLRRPRRRLGRKATIRVETAWSRRITLRGRHTSGWTFHPQTERGPGGCPKNSRRGPEANWKETDHEQFTNHDSPCERQWRCARGVGSLDGRAGHLRAKARDDVKLEIRLTGELPSHLIDAEDLVEVQAVWRTALWIADQTPGEDDNTPPWRPSRVRSVSMNRLRDELLALYQPPLRSKPVWK